MEVKINYSFSDDDLSFLRTGAIAGMQYAYGLVNNGLFRLMGVVVTLYDVPKYFSRDKGEILFFNHNSNDWEIFE
jgi:hypothetical protein